MVNLLTMNAHTDEGRERERERESTDINCHAVMLQKLLDTLRPPEVLLSNCLLSSGFSHPPKNHGFKYIVIKWGFRYSFISCILFITFSIAQGVPWLKNQNLICDRIKISTLGHNVMHQSGEII